MTPPEKNAERAETSAEERGVVRRISKFAMAGYVGFALYFLIRVDWWSLVGLTCSAAVVIINFLWLEEILVRVLQPAPLVKAWRLGVRTLARFALFGVALSVAIFVVQFNALSVLLGFSIIVVGIMAEAFYGLVKSFPADGQR